MDYPKLWNNERLTDLLIRKFIKSKQFELIIGDIDITELEVTSESDKGFDYSETRNTRVAKFRNRNNRRRIDNIMKVRIYKRRIYNKRIYFNI